MIWLGSLRGWPHDYWRRMSWQEFRGQCAFIAEETERHRRDEGKGDRVNVDEPWRDDPRFGKPPDKKTLELLPWEGEPP